MACPLPDVIWARSDGVTVHRISGDELPSTTAITGAPRCTLVADKLRAFPFAAVGLLFLLQAMKPIKRQQEKDTTHKKCFINLVFVSFTSPANQKVG